MSIDLSAFDLIEHRNCLTARDVTLHSDLYVLTYLCGHRELIAHLLDVAADLMITSQALILLYLTDGYDPDHSTQPGLTEAERHQVMTLASTCVYNAALYVQEAQRRKVPRANAGWDPITAPQTA
ncbi:hypothetical protein [Actinoplanes sp. NPDC049118]|uniref:hypothetical protein n=1 Tax=Actinoplanes sp. NPDC049118 TaxID=3155769 RepID=UPI003400C6A7